VCFSLIDLLVRFTGGAKARLEFFNKPKNEAFLLPTCMFAKWTLKALLGSLTIFVRNVFCPNNFLLFKTNRPSSRNSNILATVNTITITQPHICSKPFLINITAIAASNKLVTFDRAFEPASPRNLINTADNENTNPATSILAITDIIVGKSP
jgi:hypothetical protein